MAKVAASSFGPLIRRPVVTRSWVISNPRLVFDKFCSASIAPELVLTDIAIGSVFTDHSFVRAEKPAKFLPD